MHSPTLLIVLAILLGIMALIQIASWYFGRRFQAQIFWAGAYLSAFLSAINLLMRTEQQAIGMVLGTQISQFLTAYFMLLGARDYMGHKPWPPRYALICIGAMALNAITLTLIVSHPVLRITISSLVTGILFGLSALTIAKGPLHQYPARYIFAVPCVAHTLFVLARIGHLLQANGQVIDLVQGTSIPPFLILEPIICLVMMAFATLMLVSETITSELRTLAESDPLTGTFNRRSFMTLFDKAISAANRRSTALSVLLIDLDHFKQTNDTYGHRAGDEVLCHFVAVASSCLRKEDILGRIGGEEFAAFLPNTRIDEARIIAERLRSKVAEQALTSPHGPIPLTISIGIAQCETGELLENALHRADAAMYRAKESGRNRVELWQVGNAA